MTTKKKLILVLFGLLFTGVVVFCLSQPNLLPVLPIKHTSGQSPLKTEVLTIGQTKIKAEIADTETTRNQGLSNRKSLTKNTGMLFIFDKPGFYGFWMKEMRFSLDIIWIDESWKIIDITKNVSPKSFPTTYVASEPVKYVLEVPAGFTTQNNLDIGDIFTR
ncbi:MAG: DUF192 domain-containing protein [Candidatus Vogelbacteria bacterium]|nr:DUF192 domain-containing protein [Candidatus Vogelbacteria bacterium]